LFGPTPYALTLFISEKKDVSQVFPILHDAAAAEGSAMTSAPGGLLVRGIVCVFCSRPGRPCKDGKKIGLSAAESGLISAGRPAIFPADPTRTSPGFPGHDFDVEYIRGIE
jgi:hypothetical protein